jgi:hypothetical protein
MIDHFRPAFAHRSRGQRIGAGERYLSYFPQHRRQHEAQKPIIGGNHHHRDFMGLNGKIPAHKVSDAAQPQRLITSALAYQFGDPLF